MELVRFIFQDFWHFIGTIMILEIIVKPFLPYKESKEDKEDIKDDELQ